jgi:hypothetical protein
VWSESLVIIDEYDWIILDGKHDKVVERIKLFQQASQVIGFSGSTLSETEKSCLELAFNTLPVHFPSLDKLKGDKKTQLADILVSVNQQVYL